MKNWGVYTISAALIVGALIAGCSSSTTQHYVSPKIEGAAQLINLDAVDKAFWETKGTDFNAWMAAFEKRVNEIYDGKEIVSIDATKNEGKLVVTGYFDKVNKQGFQPGDTKLFSIEQTGESVDNQMPYRVAGNDGRPYYEGHHSILDNPILQMLIVSHMMRGWGGGYYTPAPQIVVLQHARDTFRSSPQYSQVQTQNNSFFSRFKTKSNGDLTSTNKFGGSSSTGASGTTQRRSLFGGGSQPSSASTSSASSSGSTSMWGGRRSSGFSSFKSSRGWGGRRR